MRQGGQKGLGKDSVKLGCVEGSSILYSLFKGVQVWVKVLVKLAQILRPFASVFLFTAVDDLDFHITSA